MAESGANWTSVEDVYYRFSSVTLCSQMTTHPNTTEPRHFMFQKNKKRKAPNLGKRGSVEGRVKPQVWKPAASWTVETPVSSLDSEPHHTSNQNVSLWGDSYRCQDRTLQQIILFPPFTPAEAQQLRGPAMQFSHNASALHNYIHVGRQISRCFRSQAGAHTLTPTFTKCVTADRLISLSSAHCSCLLNRRVRFLFHKVVVKMTLDSKYSESVE